MQSIYIYKTTLTCIAISSYLAISLIFLNWTGYAWSFQNPHSTQIDFKLQTDITRLDKGLSWGYCGAPPNNQPIVTQQSTIDAQTPINIVADHSEFFLQDQFGILQGNVIVDRGNQHLESERVTYERSLGLIRSPGLTLLQHPTVRLLGYNAEINLLKNQAKIAVVNYRIVGYNARGTAKSAFIKNKLHSQYRGITYTTCPRDSNAWMVWADSLEVNQKTGEAIAHNATFNILGIPVLYTPYLSIPLDNRRKSGFLFPIIGMSSRLGVDIRIPYYWNIHPQLDTTITPRIMTQRGLMLSNEIRYLTTQNQGVFTGEVLLKDTKANNTEHEGTRGKASFHQNGSFGNNWRSQINIDMVSDDTYLEDFGRGLQITSTRQMERRGDIYYYGQDWYVLGRLQSFQTIDRTIASEDRPYNRLPQILFDANIPFNTNLKLKLQAENVYFQHDTKVRGNRLALRPTLSMSFKRPYGYVKPRFILNQVNYWLNNQDANQSTRLHSTIPSFSLDSGIMLERRSNWFNMPITQTIEPRLYYLYTPYYNQDKLPVFDSAEFDFSFLSLFQTNRFSGRDRIGDTNQITFALTTNTNSEATGKRILQASIGQTFYFAKRRVQLADIEDQEGRSSIIGELTTNLTNNWSSRATMLWDPHRSNEAQLRKATLGIQYQTPQRHLINVNYRLNETDADDDTTFEDTELSWHWPISHRWRVMGRWSYSLRNNQTTEIFSGLEYSSCCWRIRGVVRDFMNNVEQKHNFSVMLQVEFTGLGTFGNSIEDFLQDTIHGYW